MKRFSVAVALLLGTALAPVAEAQSNCAIVSVGPASGIYFLAVTTGCGQTPEGYQTISDLIRDDGGSHVLIIVENGRNDAETRSIAGTLTNIMKNGGVDGHTWRDAPAEPVPAPDAEAPPEGDAPMEMEMEPPPAEEQAPAPVEVAPEQPADQATSE
jgi:hypothetical protein